MTTTLTRDWQAYCNYKGVEDVQRYATPPKWFSVFLEQYYQDNTMPYDQYILA